MSKVSRRLGAVTGSGDGDSQQVAALKSLLVRSLQAMRPADEAEILQLTAKAVEAIAGCQITGILSDLTWQEAGRQGGGLSAAEVASSGYCPSGGPIDSGGLAWTWVYPMSAESHTVGYLVVEAAQEPAASDRRL